MSVHPNIQINGIILTGMMGCGKSRVGRILRDALEWRFSDLDRAIERKVFCRAKEMQEGKCYDESRMV